MLSWCDKKLLLGILLSFYYSSILRIESGVWVLKSVLSSFITMVFELTKKILQAEFIHNLKK